MLVIVIKMNILLLAVLLFLAFALGYLVRTVFIWKCRNRILELEKEMLLDNARILELEKEKAELLRNRKESF